MGTTKILKYKVFGEGVPTSITCHKARLLDIQLQRGDMVCWVETNDDLPETTTNLISLGTGWDVPSELMDKVRYFKTVQDACGFVWHFYEVVEQAATEDT